MDERYLLHRLKATSLAGIAGAIGIGAVYLYGFFAKGVLRHELLGVLLLMGLVKLTVLGYYRRTD